MKLSFLCIILLLVVTGILLIHGKKRKIVYCLILVLVIGIFTSFLFVFNTDNQLYQWYQMNFNPLNQHNLIIYENVYSLPLPSKTIMLYRSSDTQATYLTNMKQEDVIKFYQNLSMTDFYQDVKENNTSKILFKYRDNSFLVAFKDDSSKCVFTVDLWIH